MDEMVCVWIEKHMGGFETLSTWMNNQSSYVLHTERERERETYSSYVRDIYMDEKHMI